MVELLRFLEDHGFVNYIASGGDRDFMRSVATDLRHPTRAGGGGLNALRYEEGADGGRIAYQAEPDVFDDGPSSRFASGAGSAGGRSSP